jgi:hypothetical protein
MAVRARLAQLWYACTSCSVQRASVIKLLRDLSHLDRSQSLAASFAGCKSSREPTLNNISKKRFTRLTGRHMELPALVIRNVTY